MPDFRRARNAGTNLVMRASLFLFIIAVCLSRTSEARLSASLVTSYDSYSEPNIMREYGFVQGLALGYEHLTESGRTLFQVDGDIEIGHLTYDGAVVSGSVSTPSVQRAADSIYNLRGTAGYVTQFESELILIPYAGLGYRLLTDKIEGASSYLRTVSYLYVPFGAKLVREFSDAFSIVAMSDLDVIIYGSVVSKLSDVNPSFPDLQMTNSGFGVSASVSFVYDFGSFTGHLTPYYQRWDMQQSSKSMGFVEPANQTVQVGLKIGADY